MGNDEYTTALDNLKKKHLAELNALDMGYAFSNNSYKIGDTFTDHIGSILIKKVKWTINYGETFPSCVYYGYELKKDSTPKKSGAYRKAWQSNKV